MGGQLIFTGRIHQPKHNEPKHTENQQLTVTIQHNIALGCALTGLMDILKRAASYTPDWLLTIIMDQVAQAEALRSEINHESVRLGLHASTLPQAGLEGVDHD